MNYSHFKDEIVQGEWSKQKRNARHARKQRLATASIILVVIVCFLLSAIK